MRFNRKAMLRSVSVWVLVSHVLGLVPAVFANPEGGVVVGGAAGITNAPGVTTINQSTDRAIINWRSFSNGATEHIQFNQPSSTSATVNRVTGRDASRIDGSLSANGNVFLLNPNGVVFGSTSRVNVNGLTASTLDLDDAEFMSGAKRLTLRQNPNSPLGAVVNKGQIQAGKGGIKLVAPIVDNQGTLIATDGGSVRLGAGQEAEIGVGDDDLMTIKVHGGAPGDVRLPSDGSSDVLETVVNNRNFIEAGSVRRCGGDVVLGGGEGIAINQGRIITDGTAGRSAGRVRLDSTQATVLAPGSVIRANGVGESSSGGDVRVMSEGKTLFASTAKIEARGGDTGDGGFVETSGDVGIIVRGDVDTRAPGGKNGEFLIDPNFIVITSGASGTGDQDAAFHASGGAVGILSADANSSLNTISDGKINSQLVTTDVILEAAGHIKINSGVSINLAGNHNLFFHVTDTVNTGTDAQIFGPGSGLAQISNLNPTDTGKIAFKVEDGGNNGTGKIDLTNVALDGAAGGVFIDAPSTVTLDRVLANGATGIINVKSGADIQRSNPSALGAQQGLFGKQVLLTSGVTTGNAIGSAALPVLISTPQLLVNQVSGGDAFLTNTLQAITVANRGGSGGFSLTNTGGNITVGSVTVGATNIASVCQTFSGDSGSSLTAGTTVTLNASGNIGTAGANTIVANTADLTAVTGISSPNSLQVSNLTARNTGAGVVNDINLINDRAVTFSALNSSTNAGDDILFTTSAGDITIGAGNVSSGNNVVVSATSGNIQLTGSTTVATGVGVDNLIDYAASGSINGTGLLTALGTQTNQVDIRLTAPGGIGNSVQVRTSTQDLALRSTAGNINVANSGSNLEVAARADNGFVNIQASGGNLTTDTVDGLAGIAAITAAAGRTISLVNTGGGNVVVSGAGAVSTNGQNIAIVSSNSVQLAGTVSSGSASNGATVDLIAQNGTITRVGGGLVTSGTVAASATGGIGAAGTRFNTSTSNLQLGGLSVGGVLVANGGDDFITNSGAALVLAGTGAGNLDVVNTGNDLTVGSLNAGAFAAPLPAAVTSAAQTGLTATGAAKTISLQTATSGNINVTQAITTNVGDVGIVASGSIAMGANLTAGAATGTNTVALVARAGSITRTAGTVTAGNVAVDATTGIGAATAGNRLQTSTTNLQLGGLSVGGTPVVNSGNDFIANVGGVALKVAGDTNNGNVDITQAGADLTVDEFASGIGAFSPAAITTTAQAGISPNTAGNQVSLVTVGSGNIVVVEDITTLGGDIGLVSASGVSLGANVTTGSTTGGSLVDVIALAGSIARTGGLITAGNVALAATNGMGSILARVQTSTSNLQLGGLSVNGSAVVNGGDDFVANVGGVALVFAGIDASGNVDVTQTGANLNVGSLSIGSFAPAGANSAASVTVAAQNGITTTGASRTISLVTLTSGNIVVDQDVTSTAGDIGLVSANSITLNNDVTTGSATNAALVDLISRNGSIARTAGTVTSGNVAVAATAGIGAATAGNRLQTSTSKLQIGGLSVNGGAVVNGGNDFVENVGGVALQLAGVNASGNIDVTQTGANLTVSTLNLGAFAPASTNSVALVTAQPQVGLTDTSATRTISLVTLTSGNILVASPITSNGGDIGLVAANGVSLGASVTTGNTGGVSLVDVIAQNGAITRTAGTILAGNVALSATGGIGTATARVETSTSNLQLGGLSVNGVAQTNGGDDFVSNVGAVALTFAGSNSTGDIDLTQTGADLTVGTLNVGAFAPAAGDSAASVTSAAQTGVTDTAAGQTISLVSVTSGSIHVNSAVTTNGGNIGIVSAADLSLAADVTTGATTGATLVDLIARAGAISRTAGTVTAGNVAMAATVGIGLAGAGARVRTSTSNIQLGGLTVNGTAVNNGGDDFVENIGGVPLVVAGVSATGNLDISQTGANVTIGTLTIGAFAPAGASSAASVTAATQVGLTAVTATKSVSVVTAGTGDILVNNAVTTNGGSVGLVAANSVALASNVNTGSAANAAAVDVIAQNGAITRTAGTITAGKVATAATAGIGAATAGNRVRTSTSSLQIGGLNVRPQGGGVTPVVNAGNDFFENVGSVAAQVAGVNANGDIDVTQDGANLTVNQFAAGNFNFAPAGGNSTVSITSDARDGLVTQNAGDTVSLVTATAGDIVITRGIVTNAGDVGLIAVNGVQLANNVNTGSATNASLIDVIARNGTITRTAGQLTAGKVGLAATAGIGAATVNNRVRTSTSNLQIGGLSIQPQGAGAASAVANAGNDFVENVGGIALNLSATNAGGNVDVTQDSADLSIALTTAGAFNFAPAAGQSAISVTSAAVDGVTAPAAGQSISLVTKTSGNINVNRDLVTNGGDIAVIAASNVNLADDVTTGSATNGAQVILIAQNSRIDRTAGVVTSGRIAASATGGIGLATLGNRLRTSTSSLELGGLSIQAQGAGAPTGLVNAGADFVENFGAALKVAGTNTNGAIDVTQDGSNLTVDQFAAGTFNFAPAAGQSAISVTSGAQDGLNSAAANQTVSLVTQNAGDILVNRAITTNAGSVGLVSVNNVAFAANVNTGSASNAATIDVVALGSRISRTGGTLTAGKVAVAATGGIGAATPGNRLQTSTSNLQIGALSVQAQGAGAPSAVTNAGDDFIENVGSVTLNVAGVNANGDLDVTQDGANLIVNQFAAAAFDFAPAGANSAVRITSQAQDGLVVQTAGRGISVVTQNAGDIVVTRAVNSNAGSIGLVAAGNIALANDVNTGSATNGALVDLVAQNSRITRTAGTVTAGKVAVAATGGIGAATAGNRLQTSTSNLQIGGISLQPQGAPTPFALTNAGDDFIENVGAVAVQVAGVNANGDIDVTQTGANLTVNQFATGNFNFAPRGAQSAVSITSAAQDGLSTLTSGDTISLVTITTGDIVVTRKVESNAGSIGLVSATNIALAGDVNTGSATNGAIVDLAALAGTITRTAGVVTAGRVAVAATAGIGAATAGNRLRTSTSSLQIGGLLAQAQGAGAPTAIVNGGDDFIENVGGVAVQVAGVNASGNLDVVQDGANLTVNQFAAGNFNFAPAAANSAVSLTSAAQDGLTAQGAGRTVSLVTRSTGDIVVTRDVVTNAGDVGLVSVGNIALANDINTGSATNAALVDLVALSSVISRTAGTVTAGRVAVAATGGVGAATAGNRLQTSTSNLQIGGLNVQPQGGSAFAVVNAGNDFIENVGAVAVQVAGVNAAGDIDVTQDGATLTVNQFAGGNFNFAPAAGQSAVSITSDARDGLVSALAGESISLVTKTAGDIVVTRDIVTTGGDVGLVSVAGIQLANDITTGSATNAALVDLIALAGSITRTAGTVTTGRVAVAATAGIGAATAGNRLQTSTSNLQIGGLSVQAQGAGAPTAVVNAGNDFIENVGAVAQSVAGINANGDIDLTQDGANLVVDQFASSNFNFAPAGVQSAISITSAAQDGLNVQNAGDTVSLVTKSAGDIVVNRDVVTNGGNVGLISVNNIALANDINTGSATNGAIVDLVALLSRINRTSGTVTAGKVAVAATGGIGAATPGNRLQTSTSNLQIGGLSVQAQGAGAPTAVVNAGNDFIENVGAVALNAAGVNATGDIDLTQDGANLTVNQFVAGDFDFVPAGVQSAVRVTSAAQDGINAQNAGDTITLVTLSSGDIVVTRDVVSNAGTIGLVSVNDINLANDITTGSATNGALIDLIALGSTITRTAGTVTSGKIAVAATGGIGAATAGNRLQTSTSFLQIGGLNTLAQNAVLSSPVSNGGNDFIENVGGITLRVAGVNAAGDIDLVQNNANLIVDQFAASNFNFTPVAPPLEAQSSVRIVSDARDGLVTQNAGDTISLVTLGSGDIIVNRDVITNAGDVGLVSVNNIQLANDITTGSATNGALVDLVALGSTITRTAGTVTTGRIAVAATGGIGAATAGNRLQTSTSFLQIGGLSFQPQGAGAPTAIVNGGNDFIENVGNVGIQVAGVNASGDIDVTQDGVNLVVDQFAAGNFNFAPAGVESAISLTSAAQDGLTAQNVGDTISLVTRGSGDIVVNRDVTSNAGDIALVSAEDITLANDITTGSATNGALVDLIAISSRIDRSAGTVTSGRVAVAATGGIGLATAGNRLQTATSLLQIGGLNIRRQGEADPAFVTNAGDDFIENVGGLPVSVAGVNANGLIDVTQAGANLIVDQTTAGQFDFAPAAGNSAVSITSDARDGIASEGAGRAISLVTGTSGDLVITRDLVTNGGDIALVAADNIQLANDVTTGSAINAALVDLVALNSRIDRTGGTVTSGKIAVAATGGIGTPVAGARLRTSTSALQIGGLSVQAQGACAPTAVVNGGDDFIENVDRVAVQVAGVNASGNIDLVQDATDLTVNQFAASNFNFAPAGAQSAVRVTSAAQDGLLTQAGGRTISLVTTNGGDIVVNRDVVTTGGAIGLVSADDILLANDITTGSATNGVIANLIALNRTITRTAGTITSGSVALAATGGIGAATAGNRVQTATSTLLLGGLSIQPQGAGAASTVANGGDDFVENVGGLALNVAAVNATGAIDVTQVAGNMTIDQVAAGAFDFAPAGADSAVRVTSAAQDGVDALGAGKTVALSTRTSGDITVARSVESNAGDIALVASSNLNLANDVTTGNATNAALVDLVALNSRINRTAGTVTSGRIAAEATGGTGAATAGNRLTLSARTVQLGGLSVQAQGAGSATAVANAGDVFVEMVGSVLSNVSSVNTAGHTDVVQNGADLVVNRTTAGQFDFGPAGVESEFRLTSAALDGLNSTAAGQTIALATLGTGNIVVSRPVTSNAGNIAAVSVNDIQLGSDITTGSAANASQIDLVALGGRIDRTAGVLTSGRVALSAVSGIGTATARVQAATTGLQLGGLSIQAQGAGAPTAVVNGGNDFLSLVGATGTDVAGVNANGDFDIEKDGATLAVNQFAAGAFNFAPAGADSAFSITSAAQDGLSTQGAGQAVFLFTRNAGNILVARDIVTNGGDVGLVSSTGIALADDILTGSSTDGSLVDLIALNGAITRTAGVVTSGRVALSASAGIGAATAGNRVRTATSLIQVGGLSILPLGDEVPTALANGGNDFLENVGGLPVSVAGVNANGNIDVVQNGANLLVGQSANGQFDFAPASVLSAFSVTSEAQDGVAVQTAGRSISLVTAGSGDVVVGRNLVSNGGAIGVVSAEDVLLANDVTTGSATNAGLIDVIARGGRIDRTGGVLTSGFVALAATAGIGAAGARVQTSASNLQLGGLSVNGAALVNGGDDFVANVGGVPVVLAGVNGVGNIDVTQAGANLTIGSLTAGAFAPAGANSAASVTVASQVGLRTTAAGATIAAVTLGAGDVIVDDPAITNGGAMGLVAAGGVRVQDDISTGGTATGVVDLVARAGAISRTAGVVTANGVVVSASGGVGLAGAPLVVTTPNFQTGGLSIDGTPQANAGDEFISAFGPLPVTVSGTNNGNVDFVQNGANLSVGNLSLGTFAPAGITVTAQTGLNSTAAGGTLALTTLGAGSVAFASVATAALGTVRVRSNDGVVNNLAGGNAITAVNADVLSLLGDVGSAISPLGVTVSSIDANAPAGSVFLNGFRSPNTLVNGTSAGNFSMTQVNGDLLVNSITAGGVVTLNALTGSILDGSGGTAPNITSTGGGVTTLTAAGTIGTFDNPVVTNLNPGSLGVSAGGVDGGGTSVNLAGTIVPDFTVNFLSGFAGQVAFNGRVVSGPELNVFSGSPVLVSIAGGISAIDLANISPEIFAAINSPILTTSPFQKDDFVEDDGAPDAPSPSGLDQGKSPAIAELLEKMAQLSEEDESDVSEAEARAGEAAAAGDGAGVNIDALAGSLQEQVDRAKKDSGDAESTREEESRKKSSEEQADEAKTE